MNEEQTIDNQVYSPSLNNWDVLRRSFAGEPYAFMDDPDVKDGAELLAQIDDNPEQYRKSWALAAYFAQMDKRNINFCHGNLDALIERYNGKGVSVDQAYDEIAGILNPSENNDKQNSLGSRILNNMSANVIPLANSVYNAAGAAGKFIVEGMAAQNKAELLAMGRPDAAALMREPEEAGKLAEESIRGVYKKNYQPDLEEYQKKAALPEDWATYKFGSGEWFENMLVGTVGYTPQLIAQIGFMTATGGVGAFAASTGIDKAYDLADNNPDMSAEQIAVNAMTTGLINGALEKVTFGILKGKLTKSWCQQGIAAGMKRYLAYVGIDAGSEAASEALEQLSENVVDIATGARGDTAKWNMEDYWREETRGVPESLWLGFAGGSAMAHAPYSHLREIDRTAHQARRNIETERARLNSLEKRSSEEEQRLRDTEIELDSADIHQLVQLENKIKLNREIDQFIEQQQAPPTEQDEDNSTEDVTPEAVADARRAEQRFHNVTLLPHNPGDTVKAVEQFSPIFPDMKINCYEGKQNIPQSVQMEANRLGVSPRAFIYNNEVWIDTLSVRPGDAPKVILHEIVGHKGIQTVFKNDWERFLDSVYREHADDYSFQAIAKSYLGAETRIEIDENGQKSYRIDNADSQRYAAEEYIASLAENEDVIDETGRTYLRGIIQKIKMFLARHHMWKQIRFSDREIQTALIRSARAMRKQSRIEKNDGGARFAAAPPINSENFRKWFGNSKVVDADGKPLVVYHGTDRYGFTVFQEDSFFSASEEYAKKYQNKGRQDTKSGVYACYLSIKKPFDIRNAVDRKIFTEYRNGHEPSETNSGAMDWAEYDYDDLREYLNDQYPDQYDGFIIDEGGTEDGNHRGISYVPIDPGQIKSATDNVGTYDSANPDIRFAVSPVYTGSAADYEQPSLQYIGSGEGAQAFGWGLYGSDQEGIGRTYATEDAERKAGRSSFLIEHNGKKISFGNSNKEEYIIFASAKSLDEDRVPVTKEKIKEEIQRKWKVMLGFEDKPDRIEATNLEYQGALDILDEITISDSIKGQRHLYKQTFWHGKTENLLRWDAAVSDEQKNQIMAALSQKESDPDVVSFVNREREDWNTDEETGEIEEEPEYYPADVLHDYLDTFLDFYDATGEYVYKQITGVLGSPQAASEFLYRAGIDGIKYPADGGDGSDGWNYVAFSDKDIRVDEHIRFSVAAQRLQNDVVAEVSSRAIKAKNGKTAIEVAMEFVREHLKPTYHTEIGPVDVDPNAIKQSLSHSIYQNKLDATQTIGDVLTKGVYLGDSPDKDGKPIVNYFFAAKVKIGDTEKIVFVRTRKSEGRSNRFYVHEVFTEDEIKKLGNQQTDASPELSGRMYRNASEFYRNIIAQVMNVNPDFENNTRFSVTEFTGRELDDMIAVARPFVGAVMNRTDSEYLAYLKEKGCPVETEEQAHMIAAFAVKENMAAKRQLGIELRNQYIRENFPFVALALELSGDNWNFKIVPDYSHFGEGFTGTFIADAWRRKGALKEEISSQQKEQQRRKLERAKGIKSEEMARILAQRSGADPLAIENEIVQFFRDMTKPKLFEIYTKDTRRAERQFEADAKAEYEAREEQRASQEVEEFIKYGGDITPELLHDKLVAAKLYEFVMGVPLNRELRIVNPDGTSSAPDWDAVRAAMKSPEFTDRQAAAQAFRAGEEKARQKYIDELAKLRKKILEDKADALKITQQATAFARTHLPREVRGDFIGKITALARFSNLKSRAYPDGKRAAMLNRLLQEMAQRSETENRKKAIADIRAMLAAAKERTNYKGYRVSIMPKAVADVARIRQVIDWDYAACAQTLEANAEAILDAENDSSEKRDEKLENADNLRHDNDIIREFGMLETQSAKSVSSAFEHLKKMIFDAKGEYRSKITEELAELKAERERVIVEITGDGIVEDARELSKIQKTLAAPRNFIYESSSIQDLLRELSGRRFDEFDDSRMGRLYRMIEDSENKSATRIRKLQEEFYAQMEKSGIKGELAVGKFLRECGRVRSGEESKVTYIRYLRTQKNSDGITITDKGKREAVTCQVSIENARAMMTDMNSGKFTPGGYFKIKPSDDMEHYRAVRNVLRDLFGVKTGRVFSVWFGRNSENKQVARIYSHNEDGLDRAEGYELSIDDFLKSVEQHGDVFPVSREAVEMLTLQIKDRDSGVKAAMSMFGDRERDAGFNALKADQDKYAKGVLYLSNPDEKSERIELELSPGQALQLYLTWNQEHYKPNMRWNGFDENTIQSIEGIIDQVKGLRELGEWMLQKWRQGHNELNEKVIEKYGAPMPVLENYHPASFGETVAKEIRDAGFGRLAGGMSVNAGFLTQRKFHLRPIDFSTDAFSIFTSRQMEQIHFLAWTDTVRELRGIFSDTMVQRAIRQKLGDHFLQQLIERIEVLASGGNRRNEVVEKYVGMLYQYWIPAKIGLNIASYGKQIAGMISYSNYIPATKLAGNLSYAFTHYAEFAAFVRWAMDTDFYKNRMAGGLDPFMRSMLSRVRNGRDTNALLYVIMKYATAGTMKTDAVSCLVGGFACHKYYMDKAMKEGKSKQQAAEIAARMWMRATDDTQQSGALKDKNHFQYDQGLARCLTVFTSAPTRAAMLQIRHVRDFLKYKDFRSFNPVTRDLIMDHLVLGSAMFLISKIVRDGVNIDNWDEDDFQDWAIACLFGSMNSLWLFGNLAQAIVQLSADSMRGKSSYGKRFFSAFPVVDDAQRAISNVNRLYRKEDAHSADDFFSLIENIGTPMMMIPGPVGQAGSLASMIGSQGKRIIKSLTRKED